MMIINVFNKQFCFVLFSILIQFCYFCSAQNKTSLQNYTFGDFGNVKGSNFTGVSRDSFSLFYDLSEEMVYVFGGKASGNNSVLGSSNLLDAWSFNISTLQWKKLPQSLNSSGHCTVQLNNNVYIFGGVGTFSNALQVANMSVIDSIEFTLVNTNAPGGHELYPACTIHSEANLIYVFGGANQSNPNSCTNELMTFNISSGMWHSVNVSSNSTRPSPRKGATLEAIYDDNDLLQFLVLIGGDPCGDVSPYQSIWWFNVSSISWIQAAENHNSSHIAYHTSSRTHESGVLVVYGGESIYDSTLNQGLYIYTTLNHTWSPSPSWFAPKLSSDLPEARTRHSSVYSNQRIFYYGANENANTMLQLSISAFCSIYGKDCGNCVLYPGCGYCVSKNNASEWSCVPGASAPYVARQCDANMNNTFNDYSQVSVCRTDHYIPALLPVTCVVIVLIFVLVVVTYYVDWRMKKKKALNNRGYEYIG